MCRATKRSSGVCMCRSGEGSERFARVVVAVSALYSVRKGETIPILLVKKGNFRCKHAVKVPSSKRKVSSVAICLSFVIAHRQLTHGCQHQNKHVLVSVLRTGCAAGVCGCNKTKQPSARTRTAKTGMVERKTTHLNHSHRSRKCILHRTLHSSIGASPIWHSI